MAFHKFCILFCLLEMFICLVPTKILINKSEFIKPFLAVYCSRCWELATWSTSFQCHAWVTTLVHASSILVDVIIVSLSPPPLHPLNSSWITEVILLNSSNSKSIKAWRERAGGIRARFSLYMKVVFAWNHASI